MILAVLLAMAPASGVMAAGGGGGDKKEGKEGEAVEPSEPVVTLGPMVIAVDTQGANRYRTVTIKFDIISKEETMFACAFGPRLLDAVVIATTRKPALLTENDKINVEELQPRLFELGKQVIGKDVLTTVRVIPWDGVGLNGVMSKKRKKAPTGFCS